MSNKLLEIEKLSSGLKEKSILSDINLSIGCGETHVLLGPNGAGKSTLGNTIMGHPLYVVTNGKITFCDEDITTLAPDKRAKKGLFMTFQIGRASCRERV